MARPKKGERHLGPYDNGDGSFRIIEVGGDGTTTRHRFASEAEAVKYLEIVSVGLAAGSFDTETALDAYLKYLTADKGNKEGSNYQTKVAIRRFFPQPTPLRSIKPATVQKAYDDLRKKGGAVATHRNSLAQVKTFFRWCVKKGILATNPAEKVEGVGKRNKRKPQLRTKEARRWYAAAIDLAMDGHKTARHGAAAALLALLLGMRASEITAIKVRDLDEDEEPFDSLWIDDSKTDAGRRSLEVPSDLRPILEALAAGKAPDDLLFEAPKAAGGRRWRDWPRRNVHRICDEVGVDRVSAHGMRGLLATLSLKGGAAGHVVAQTLGHEEVRTTTESYAQRGSLEAGLRKRGAEKLKPSRAKSL